ncbi:MAG: M1 family metallopeptidase [Saprospiraceae bacterium]
MNRTIVISILSLVCMINNGKAQSSFFTMDDTLRGSITAERAWWDLTFYKLQIKVDPDKKAISGSNEIRYKVLKTSNVMQIDLQPPLEISKIEQNGETLEYQKKGQNAYFVTLKSPQNPGDQKSITVWYSGKPREARNAPWDGGFSWKEHDDGKPFVATSCQGLGASAWWPCKDHMYDEPDSMAISVTVPEGLMDVSNGRLRKVSTNKDGSNTYDWFVKNPINNYGVNVNIADYASWSDTLHGEKGVLTLDFFVLPENLKKAKVHFQQAKSTIRAFEYWFGPYPFYEDGYKLVEVPYLGMEHQSSVTYGNKYKNGYLGMDLSFTGWGKKWDFIIVHESGHEWFANNITYSDAADMWIHEGFTNYSECLYIEYYYGKEAGAEYARGLRKSIQNDRPIVGQYNVNNEGSSDMYNKGANMLHTIRQIVDNDSLWREILRGLNRDFYHQVVSGAQIEAYMIEKSGKNLQKVFDQYLRDVRIPVLEYKFSKKGKLSYRWSNCVNGFNMPIKIEVKSGEYAFIYPETSWKTSPCEGKKGDTITADKNFYVKYDKQ